MTPAQRRMIIPLASLGLGLVLLLLTAWVILSDRNQPGGGTVKIGGPFALISQEGEVISNKDLLGAPFLVFFGFTHCPDVCPTALYEMSEVFRKLGPDKKIKALFVTVDPERDSAAKLKDYLSSFDKRIIGVTGKPAQLEAMRKAYRVYARKVPTKDGDYTMDHSAIVYLMNKRGAFVSAFNLKQPPEKAAKELENYL